MLHVGRSGRETDPRRETIRSQAGVRHKGPEDRREGRGRRRTNGRTRVCMQTRSCQGVADERRRVCKARASLNDRLGTRRACNEAALWQKACHISPAARGARGADLGGIAMSIARGYRYVSRRGSRAALSWCKVTHQRGAKYLAKAVPESERRSLCLGRCQTPCQYDRAIWHGGCKQETRLCGKRRAMRRDATWSPRGGAHRYRYTNSGGYTVVTREICPVLHYSGASVRRDAGKRRASRRRWPEGRGEGATERSQRPRTPICLGVQRSETYREGAMYGVSAVVPPVPP